MASKVFLRSLSSQGRQNLRDRSKKASSAPFQSHIDSATAKNKRGRGIVGLDTAPHDGTELSKVFRTERPARVVRAGTPNVAAVASAALNDVPSSRRVLEARGTSEMFQESATASHRRIRKVDSVSADRGDGIGGSVVASMSATAKYRQQRRVSKAALTNPSSLTLPLTKPKFDHPIMKEIVTPRRIEKESLPEIDTSTRTSKSPAAYVTATIVVVVGGLSFAMFGSDLAALVL